MILLFVTLSLLNLPPWSCGKPTDQLEKTDHLEKIKK